MYKNHCSDPDILLLNCPQNAGNSVEIELNSVEIE